MHVRLRGLAHQLAQAVAVTLLIVAPALAVAQGIVDPRLPSPPTPPTPSEPRIPLAPGLRSRAPALQDVKYAIKAMQLTALQEQNLAVVRARFSPSIKAYVERLNALDQRSATGTTRDTLKATEDTLKSIIAAERLAADSLITPAQRQRYLDALRDVHAATVIPPSKSPSKAQQSTHTAASATASRNVSTSGSASGSANVSALVPIPSSTSSKGRKP